jgi:site-specific recombinase XerD
MAHKCSSPMTPILLYTQNQRSPHTAKNALYRLRCFANWLEREHRIKDLKKIQTQHILNYKANLCHLAASSQAGIIETIRGFFRWCYAEQLIAHDPAAQVKSPRPLRNKEPEYLTTEETRKLFNCVDRHSPYAKRDRALLWTLSYGLRVGEVASLSVGDIVYQKERLPGLRVRGKGTRERIVPLCDAALKVIRQYLSARNHPPTDAPLFVCTYSGEDNRRMTTRGIQERFKRLCKRAGIKPEKAHCHACRHGAAQRWLFESTAPGGVYTVSHLLGHGSISTTERYLRLDKRALEVAVLSDPLAGKRK